MCGIVGALTFKNNNFTVTKSFIARMRDTMTHRGPDGAGVWVAADGRIGLGHRRLSIIDLSEKAAQPMCNEDESLWISFNGEIYNHAEIRRELESTGLHSWKTDHSDTEMILHAFEHWGIECINKFRGMFAIALWDARKRELWLIRDRIGIKPLYCSFHHGRLTFASEIKALLQDPDQRRAVHDEAFYHFLSFLTTPAPQTLFDGIKKIPNGTWIKVNEHGNVSENRYWDVWDHTSPMTDVSEEEIAQCLLGGLRDSVKLRKISDVPVGVFLSGGIDSSVNAALFAEGEGGTVKTFTIGYDGDYRSYPNETVYARIMAEKVGAEYHEQLLSVDDLFEFLPKMVLLQDEPIADPVCIPVYYVSKLARDHGVIVCQVGEGADELFCGYPGWKTALTLQNLNDLSVPSLFKKFGLSILNFMNSDRNGYYEYLRRGALGQPIFWGGAEAFTEVHKNRLLSEKYRKMYSHFSSWEVIKPIRRRFEENAWEKSHLNWMTYIDLNLRLPELLLMRVDKMSMGIGLECRVPFLDHKFVELAMSIPTSVKLKRSELKYILKRAVRGVIPDEIINRKKQGFGVPVYEWFFDRLGEKTRLELSDFCKQTDYFDKKEVDYLISNRRGPQLWYLLNFALWWKAYIQ